MAHQQPYDPYYLHPAPEYGFNNDRNGINTLFVSGLPDDVKAREIHNLFRRRSGFDSCQLKYTGRGSQVVAFATFVNHQSAMAALHSLNGVKFDPQTGSVLHIEMARSNSRRKRKPDSGASESDEPSGANQSDSGDKSELAVAKSGETVGGAENTVAAENEQTEKTVDGVSPCSTLFIANLGPNCTEDELKQFLSQYPGFKVLKVRARGGMPVAFADFEDVEQATLAMGALQGSLIPSSDRGGMHIEYARSKMRKS
ncbi:hypothetical protein ACSBR1_023891 [Camellia fascicularis]